MNDGTVRITLIDPNWHGQDQSPDRLRAAGAAQSREALLELRRGDEGAERLARRALRTLVDAFLADRRTNADLFAAAHALGDIVQSTFGCPLKFENDTYIIRCPVMALHREVAHSLAMVEITECTICGAGPFDCLHVPGETYDGQLCQLRVTGIGSDGHIAWTADPDFIYTWHRDFDVSTSDLIAADNIKKAGDTAHCHHCQNCPGHPTQGDLDPVKRFQDALARALGQNED